MRGPRDWLCLLLLVAGCDRGAAEDSAPSSAASTRPGPSITKLEDACRNNDAAACDRLGAMYLVGKDVAADEKRAAELRQKALGLYLEACRAGDKAACEAVGPLPRPVTPPPPPPPPPQGADGPLNVTILPSGELRVDETSVSESDLRTRASATCAANPDQRVVIRADSGAPFAGIVKVLDLLKSAGCAKIAFGTAPSPAPSSSTGP